MISALAKFLFTQLKSGLLPTACLLFLASCQGSRFSDADKARFFAADARSFQDAISQYLQSLRDLPKSDTLSNSLDKKKMKQNEYFKACLFDSPDIYSGNEYGFQVSGGKIYIIASGKDKVLKTGDDIKFLLVTVVDDSFILNDIK